jgi:carbonic anhydrase
MTGVGGITARRRAILQGGGLAALALAGCNASVDAAPPVLARTTTGPEALARLAEGNQRFAAGQPTHPNQAPATRTAQTDAQSPFAQIVACVDSRVPPELIFDQGLGDLLVARTAGEVLDGAVRGSVLYGIEVLQIPLLLVLGHQDCGAVKSTIDVVEGKATPTGTDIDAIVNAIRPAVVRARDQHAQDLLLTSTRYNVEDIIGVLRPNPVVAAAIAKGSLQLAGGYYDIGTGRVSFFG